MICSMTGFARGEKRGAYGTLVWELRSVNHRYLDISLRLPDNLRALELESREHLAKVLRRGRLDGQLRFEPVSGSEAVLQVDEDHAHAVADAANRLREFLHPAAPASAFELLRWPGVVRDPQVDVQVLGTEALMLLDATLATLSGMRAREGARIGEQLLERARQISGIVTVVRGHIGNIREQLHIKLRARFDELKLNVDENRLEQELVLLLQRLDVSEELDRLDGHVSELKSALTKNEAAGRRLDFLMQEFNREANTLGSKCQDGAVTRQVIELKVLIEQMREQIQNVE